MARPKKYIISLSETDVDKLQAIIRKKDTSKSIIRRCQILLELNENNPRHLTQIQIANSFGVCKATVSNIVKDYIELACSQPPEGRTRWTLRPLEETLRVVLDTPIGKDTIRDILKKRNLSLT